MDCVIDVRPSVAWAAIRPCWRIPLSVYLTMPIAAATTGRFWCIICNTHHLSKSIVNWHELGRAIPGGVTSAVVDGQVNAEDLAVEQPRKCACQDAGHVTGHFDDAPMVPNNDTFTLDGPSTWDDSAEQDCVEQAVPAAVLLSAATAWTWLGCTWIEDVPDKGDTPKGKHNTSSKPNIVQDVLDGKHYCLLLGQLVMPVGLSKLLHKYFKDHQDIALSLSTDSYMPFKNQRKTAWPLIIYNYNLPPKTRFLEENVLFLGVIPSPNKPKDFDSFLWPLIEELLVLKGLGVDAWDAVAPETFRLHAHLLLVFGDIPAVSMVMCMKGHNGVSPCRYCEIKGVKNSDGPYYMPLDHSNHPSS
jgi:hypothetical protein